MSELITQETVESMPAGSELRIGRGTIITPSARDAAEARGIRIVEPGETKGEGGRAAARTTSTAGSTPQQCCRAGQSGEPAATGPEQVIVTAIGRNRPKILAELTGRIAELNGNVMDINQRILQDYFTTIMIVDISGVQGDFAAFKQALESCSRPDDYRVSVQHEKVFNFMHRV